MSEGRAKVESLLRNPFVDFFGNLLIQGVLLGLGALATLLAAWIFGFEQWSNRAQVMGMAIVLLLMMLALTVAALFWARRKPERPTGAQPATSEPQR
jgi:sterol desaturase/sphingolipid hydroxylase (fatty acid hydroxylase superfamily)